jgi:hypothetical protein
MYLQRFEYRDGVPKEVVDAAWVEAFKVWAKYGNWGGVEKGVTLHQSYGSGAGGYGLIEVDDPEAFAQYQLFHLQNYGHAVNVTWEPIFDLAKAFASTIDSFR